MTTVSLKHSILSPQELAAVQNTVRLSCEAFKQIGYPLFYDCFLTHMYNMVQMGAAAATAAYPALKSNYHEFGAELETLASFMRNVRAFNYYKTEILKEKN